MCQKNPLSDSVFSPVSNSSKYSEISEDDEVFNLVKEFDQLKDQIPDYKNNFVDMILEDTGNSTETVPPEEPLYTATPLPPTPLPQDNQPHARINNTSHIPVDQQLLFCLGFIMTLL